MAELKKQRFCPLRVGSDGLPCLCLQVSLPGGSVGCAWWMAYESQCAVVVLAEVLKGLKERGKGIK